MSRRQLIIVYSVIIFMMVWGFDLINAIKFNTPVTLKNSFSVFHVSQIIYAFVTLFFVSAIATKFYRERRYLHLVISLILSVFIFVLLRYFLEEALYPVLLNTRNYADNTGFGYYLLDNIYYGIIYVVLGGLVFLLDNQVRNQKNQVLLLQKNREAELQFLRSQINPHFLFNTLNNIYSLVYEKSEKAPHAMLKLSELLRYTLYEKKEWVPIQKEWQYIQGFIELEKLRFDREPNIQILLKGDPGNLQIAPHLLVPFVENAFKHGSLTDAHVPLTISLDIRKNELLFTTENKISHTNKDLAGGVGLDNIKRRLELLYPGKYSLQIKTNDNRFSTILTLKL